MSSEFIDKLVISLVSAVVGFILNEINHRIRERKAVVATVAEAYVKEVRDRPDTPESRLSAMQRAGVGRFSGRQIKNFCTTAVKLGCTHPFKDSQILGYFPINKIPLVLRYASEKGVQLMNERTLLEFMRHLVAEGQKKEAKKSGEDSDQDRFEVQL